MLRGFKDNMDILKEALQITVVEVAVVMEDELGEVKDGGKDECVGRKVESMEDRGDRYCSLKVLAVDRLVFRSGVSARN